MYDEVNDRYYRRAFHIDLRSGKKGPRGYEFRHFKDIGKSINLSSNMVQKISSNMFDTDSRQTLHLQQNIFAKDSCGRQTVHQKRIPNHLAYRLCECFTYLLSQQPFQFLPDE